MNSFAVRWHNFRSFEDTGWITFKPITVLIGANASGKTSVLGPLLMLKQTLESNDRTLPLRTTGSLFNAGSYENLIYRHQTDRDLTLSLRRGPTIPRKGKSLPPPNQFEFVFDQNPEDPGIASLKSFQVLSKDGQILLRRSRRSRGGYSIAGRNIRSRDGAVARSILRSRPEYFLFPFADVLNAHFTEARASTPEKEGVQLVESKLEIKAEEALYIQILAYTSRCVEGACESLSFIGPLREHPRRLYEIIGDDPKHVGTCGEYAPEILFRRRDSAMMSEVNEWIRRFEFGRELSCEKVTPGAYALFLRRTSTAPAVNLADTGFGLSQVLPIIVQCFFGRKDDLIMMEQPEIHLNPKLQAVLGELFTAVVRRGKTLVLETHSEHIILRLRRLVAEGKLKADQVGLYYAEKAKDTSRIVEIPIEENGHIPPEKWPERFFEDTLHEAFALAIAQERR